MSAWNERYPMGNFEKSFHSLRARMTIIAHVTLPPKHNIVQVREKMLHAAILVTVISTLPAECAEGLKGLFFKGVAIQQYLGMLTCAA